MSQLELLDLARSSQQNINGEFAQAITITFAMVIAIYYFLHQAGLRMKLFAFALYVCGMLVYLGQMLTESGVGIGAEKMLEQLPQDKLALPVQVYLGVAQSWVGTLSDILFNGVYWVLLLGTGYLVFFWKPPHGHAPPEVPHAPR